MSYERERQGCRVIAVSCADVLFPYLKTESFGTTQTSILTEQAATRKMLSADLPTGADS